MASPLLSGFRNLATLITSAWAGGTVYPTTAADPERARPAHPDLARDFIDLLPQVRFKQAVSDCRWLAIASDVVSGAIGQKADYVSASHWATHYAGPDRAWGEAAEAATLQLNALCTTRGERYDWEKLWWLTIPHCAADGGLFLNLTETDTGWPLVQPLEAPRVGSRDDKQVVAPKSARSYQRAESGKLTRIYTPYAGLKIVNGIIYTEAGTEAAYRVLGGAEDGTDDVDVSAQDMIHVANPRWFSEGRPMPELAPSALALQDIHLARQAQLTKHLHSARQIAVETNATGLSPAVTRLQDPLATRQGTPTKVVEEGSFRFVKSGYALTPWDTKTPGGEWMAFDDKTIASALHAIRWRAEMSDPSKAGTGANTRSFADQINTTIYAEFHARKAAVLRVRRWQIAKLIQRGDLKANDSWWQWGVTPPPEFSPDPGRAITSELEAVRAGAQSMPHVHRRWGQRPRDVLNEQADYLLLRRQVATEKGLTPEETASLGTLSQPGDNPPSPSPAASSGGTNQP